MFFCINMLVQLLTNILIRHSNYIYTNKQFPSECSAYNIWLEEKHVNIEAIKRNTEHMFWNIIHGTSLKTCQWRAQSWACVASPIQQIPTYSLCYTFVYIVCFPVLRSNSRSPRLGNTNLPTLGVKSKRGQHFMHSGSKRLYNQRLLPNLQSIWFLPNPNYTPVY